MRTNATEFFEGVVEPTVAEFFSDERNIRRARLAAIVLYHMADYWSLQTLKMDRSNEFDDVLIGECSDFLLIRDAANASKHAKLSRNNRNNLRQLDTSEQVTSTPGISDAPFGEGVFGEAVTVFLRLNDGTERSISSAIRNVTDLWKVKVEALRAS